MRAISLWEPWASAVAIGIKAFETRGWATSYKGPLAIHAAKTREHAWFIHDTEVRAAFEAHGIVSEKDLPFGCVVCTCRLVGVKRVENIRRELSPIELALGNYDAGRFAWELADVKRLETPVPARGSQGFWTWEGGQDFPEPPASE